MLNEANHIRRNGAYYLKKKQVSKHVLKHVLNKMQNIDIRLSVCDPENGGLGSNLVDAPHSALGLNQRKVE